MKMAAWGGPLPEPKISGLSEYFTTTGGRLRFFWVKMV